MNSMYGNSNQPIIDVEPVSYSGWRGVSNSASSQTGAESADAPNRVYVYEWSSARPQAYSQEGYVRAAYPAWSPLRALGGMVQVAIGMGLVGIGVPMLLLPGPGLLTIAVGGLLASSGMRKVLGR